MQLNPFTFIMDMMAAIGKSYDAAVEERKARGIASERKKAAKAFNDLYTYRFRYNTSSKNERLPGTGMYGFTPEQGYAWMCPTCNKIHLAESCSAMSGLQYPNCCEYRTGHRLYEGLKTK